MYVDETGTGNMLHNVTSGTLITWHLMVIGWTTCQFKNWFRWFSAAVIALIEWTTKLHEHLCTLLDNFTYMVCPPICTVSRKSLVFSIELVWCVLGSH